MCNCSVFSSCYNYTKHLASTSLSSSCNIVSFLISGLNWILPCFDCCLRYHSSEFKFRFSFCFNVSLNWRYFIIVLFELEWKQDVDIQVLIWKICFWYLNSSTSQQNIDVLHDFLFPRQLLLRFLICYLTSYRNTTFSAATVSLRINQNISGEGSRRKRLLLSLLLGGRGGGASAATSRGGGPEIGAVASRHVLRACDRNQAQPPAPQVCAPSPVLRHHHI